MILATAPDLTCGMVCTPGEALNAWSVAGFSRYCNSTSEVSASSFSVLSV
jgi:hypothetical protein